MARLEGFQEENNDTTTSIKRVRSPFQDGVVFTISGYSYKKAIFEIDGKAVEGHLNPVLTTSVGDLFLSMVTRSRVKSDCTIITPDGTFNKFVREQIAKHNTNGEIMQAIVDGCKDRKIVVSLVPYSKLTKNGTQIATALVELNFVE